MASKSIRCTGLTVFDMQEHLALAKVSLSLWVGWKLHARPPVLATVVPLPEAEDSGRSSALTESRDRPESRPGPRRLRTAAAARGRPGSVLAPSFLPPIASGRPRGFIKCGECSQVRVCRGKNRPVQSRASARTDVVAWLLPAAAKQTFAVSSRKPDARLVPARLGWEVQRGTWTRDGRSCFWWRSSAAGGWQMPYESERKRKVSHGGEDCARWPLSVVYDRPTGDKQCFAPVTAENSRIFIAGTAVQWFKRPGNGERESRTRITLKQKSNTRKPNTLRNPIIKHGHLKNHSILKSRNARNHCKLQLNIRDNFDS